MAAVSLFSSSETLRPGPGLRRPSRVIAGEADVHFFPSVPGSGDRSPRDSLFSSRREPLASLTLFLDDHYDDRAGHLSSMVMLVAVAAAVFGCYPRDSLWRRRRRASNLAHRVGAFRRPDHQPAGAGWEPAPRKRKLPVVRSFPVPRRCASPPLPCLFSFFFKYSIFFEASLLDMGGGNGFR